MITVGSYWNRSFLGKKLFHRYQHGYIILVPEIGEDSEINDPFTKNNGLPEFNNITIENCRAAIAKQSLEFEEVVKNIEKELTGNQQKDIFHQVFNPLETLGERLDLIWGLSKTLYLGNSTLMPTSSYIAIHERARQARATKYNNRGIYDAVKSVLATETGRSSEECRILQKFAVEGRLNGLELDSKKSAILSEYLGKLSKEKTVFKQKTEISTKRFSQTVTDYHMVKDFPDYVLTAISIDPNFPQKGPWKLTLQPYTYKAVMKYCPDYQIRWNLWQASVSRGSNFGDGELKTSLNLEEIRSLKRDVARLLGFKTYADMSLQTKMATNISEIKNTINNLVEEAKPSEENEVKELHEFALTKGFTGTSLELWDVEYWKEQQQKHLFVYSENDFKTYFPLKSVMKGLFEFCEKMFDIKIRERPHTTVWHKDVKFYDIFEEHSSAPIAGFYFDPYARHQQKLKIDTNGWMIAIQNRSEIAKRRPLSALIFNFDPPKENDKSCLSFKETKNLFQKFGNNLQHLLTRTRYSEVAGLSNIEWDAVEVCGHVFRHWLLSKQLMDTITSHSETGEKMPDDMFEALVSSEKHMAGLDLCNELYVASLDLELHSSTEFWLDIVKHLWPQYKTLKLHKTDVHPCSLTAIITDEWGAAYYSHVWSRMMAADIYSAFHEVKENEQKFLEIGQRFRKTFLSLGGSVHPAQIFREFRGRDPSPRALLKSLGLKKK